jgi:hypothetical protein
MFLQSLFGKPAPAEGNPQPASPAGEESRPPSPAPSAAEDSPLDLLGEPPAAEAAPAPAATQETGADQSKAGQESAPEFAAPLSPPQPTPAQAETHMPPELPHPLVAEMSEKLSRLPQALQDLAGAINAQASLNERLQEVLASLAEPNQDLIHAVESLSSEGQKQTDALQTLSQRLTEKRESDAASADVVGRLPALLEGLQRSNAAVVEMMEEIRDRWASTKDDLAKEMVRQGRKTTALVIAILSLLGVQTVLLIIRFVTNR